MADTLAPTTELEAVNAMIRTIGMSPATTLDVSDVDVQQALDTLRDISRQVQSAGWDFNTEENYTLTPNTDGFIVVPPNIVTVKVDKSCSPYDAVQRYNAGAKKLYDRNKHTFTFTTPVNATVVMLFDFEELPEVARRYIAVRAARVFQDNAEGLADGHTYTAQDEQTAWIELQNYEAETGDYRYRTN